MTEKVDEKDDVIGARSRLDALLNEMIDKSSEQSSHSSASLIEDPIQTSMKDEFVPITPTKRNTSQPRTPRRKRKKDSFYEDYGNANMRASYVIKIFDRHIDLAKFQKDTPLYVLVREWMKNKQYEASGLPPVHYDKVVSQEGGLDLLPSIKQEYPLYPRPLPPALKTALLENVIDTENDIETLKKENMTRWKKIKNRWREHSILRQNSNIPNLLFLKQAYTPATES